MSMLTSFASMITSANRIHKVIADEQADTGKQYIGALVEETTPSGNKLEAVITDIEWCNSCGLKGNYLIYISYTDDDKLVPGTWTTRECITLKGSE